MNKLIIAITAAIFAMGTMLSSSAQAGMKGKLGIGLAIGAAAIIASQHHHYEQRRAYKRRHLRRQAKQHRTTKKAYAKKTTSKPKEVEVAKAEPELTEMPIKKGVVRQNSSIATAALPTAEAQPEKEADAAIETETADATADEPAVATVADETPGAKRLDCKKFFASVGMTLSVPCE